MFVYSTNILQSWTPTFE